MKPTRKLSARAVKSAVFHTLKDEGMLQPRTATDIEALEEEFGKFPKTKLNPLDALRLAAACKDEPAAQDDPAAVQFNQRIEQEFGLAARKGASIPAETWARMRADRKKAEEDRKHESRQ